MVDQNENVNTDSNPSYCNKKVVINPKALLIEEFIFNDVNNLNTLLTQMVNSYRLLVGAAEEFNRISFASKDDVDDAVARADELGDLLDDVVQVLGIKTRRFLRLVSRKDILRILLNEEVDALERIKQKQKSNPNPNPVNNSSEGDIEFEFTQKIQEESDDELNED